MVRFKVIKILQRNKLHTMEANNSFVAFELPKWGSAEAWCDDDRGQERDSIGRCWMGGMAPFAGAWVTSGALAVDTNHGFIRTALSI